MSSDVDPAFREYERTVVTAFDAYVKSGLDRYLAAMEKDLQAAGVPARLQLMQSRGGVCSSRIARQRPIRLFLSGPAAGVVGAREVRPLGRAGRPDHGRHRRHELRHRPDREGTAGDPARTACSTGSASGCRWSTSTRSARAAAASPGSTPAAACGSARSPPGAEPGPACYGRGGKEATVTDASIVLGYLDPAYFAGGTLRLNPDLAVRAVKEKVADPLGLTVRQAALGIHRVVNVQMAEGIRLVSISRGVDPRSFSLMPFGGGGALHATALARELGMSRVVVPRYPGVLCAAGLAVGECRARGLGRLRAPVCRDRPGRRGEDLWPPGAGVRGANARRRHRRRRRRDRLLCRHLLCRPGASHRGPARPVGPRRCCSIAPTANSANCTTGCTATARAHRPAS